MLTVTELPGKMVLMDLFEARLPQNFNFQKPLYL